MSIYFYLAIIGLVLVGVWYQTRYEKRTGKKLPLVGKQIMEWGPVTNPFVIVGMIVAVIAFAVWYFFVKP
ncbi:MAG: hypothetical protein WA021_00795 [Minisyncoccia bacterium]